MIEESHTFNPLNKKYILELKEMACKIIKLFIEKEIPLTIQEIVDLTKYNRKNVIKTLNFLNIFHVLSYKKSNSQEPEGDPYNLKYFLSQTPHSKTYIKNIYEKKSLPFKKFRKAISNIYLKEKVIPSILKIFIEKKESLNIIDLKDYLDYRDIEIKHSLSYLRIFGVLKRTKKQFDLKQKEGDKFLINKMLEGKFITRNDKLTWKKLNRQEMTCRIITILQEKNDFMSVMDIMKETSYKYEDVDSILRKLLRYGVLYKKGIHTRPLGKGGMKTIHYILKKEPKVDELIEKIMRNEPITIKEYLKKDFITNKESKNKFQPVNFPNVKGIFTENILIPDLIPFFSSRFNAVNPNEFYFTPEGERVEFTFGDVEGVIKDIKTSQVKNWDFGIDITSDRRIYSIMSKIKSRNYRKHLKEGLIIISVAEIPNKIWNTYFRTSISYDNIIICGMNTKIKNKNLLDSKIIFCSRDMPDDAIIIRGTTADRIKKGLEILFPKRKKKELELSFSKKVPEAIEFLSKHTLESGGYIMLEKAKELGFGSSVFKRHLRKKILKNQ
ncbi:MAG: hypothetical protein HWN67_04255 [Candidatus Helarchaeota archaeon]|nr:hypothetical protein [Candidatus Helarchaeota archaeon]